MSLHVGKWRNVSKLHPPSGDKLIQPTDDAKNHLTLQVHMYVWRSVPSAKSWTFVLNVLKSLGLSMTHSISKHRVNVKNQFLWVCFPWKSLYSTPASGYLKLLLLLNSGHRFLVFSLSQYSTNLVKLTLISLHYCSYLPCIGCHALQFGSGIHCWTVNSMLYYCFLESHREDCQVTSITWRFLGYKEKQTHQNPKHVLFG